MKRKVSKSDYQLLEKEFRFLEETGHLQPKQANKLLSNYEPAGKINFVHTLLVIGAILIGVGVLSFIAGNWQVMPKIVKFLVLFIATAGFYIGGYQLEGAYPKTSRSLYYVGIFVYGAAIFLIGQTFHISNSGYADFLLWGIGILPLAYLLKDKFIAAAVAILFTIAAFQSAYGLPYALFFLIPFLYWMNASRMRHAKILFLLNSILALALLLNITFYFHFPDWITAILFFVIGFFFVFYPLRHYSEVAEWLGSFVYGFAGILLTFPSIWVDTANTSTGTTLAAIFTVLFIAILIFLLKNGSLPAILVTCSLIIRFYADLSYDFMPKSLFFVIGGCILISFGFWFEKVRRDGENDETREE